MNACLPSSFGFRISSMNDDDLRKAVISFGASDLGVARPDDGPLPYAVSVAVRLSDAVIDEIKDSPTYTYFNHYRSVNYLLDQILLRTGLWLQERCGRYITAAASQSRPDSSFEGRYSHKKAACLAGMGYMGRNGLFLHHEWGPRVRLATVFTDWAGCGTFIEERQQDDPDGSGTSCALCGLCVAACPAHALDNEDFNARRCSDWMKKEYQHIGRGAVCGICIQVCPKKEGNK